MNNNLENIGQQVDRIDNLIAGLAMPLLFQNQIEHLKKILPEISEQIKNSVIKESGENPWK